MRRLCSKSNIYQYTYLLIYVQTMEVDHIHAENQGKIQQQSMEVDQTENQGTNQQQPLENWTDIQAELANISKDRQEIEKEAILHVKGPNYKNFRETHNRSYKYCEICSEAETRERNYMKPVYHKHGSSKTYMINAPLDKKGQYFCYTCKDSPHRIHPRQRSPLLISSSTLHDWQGMRSYTGYTGDALHMDFITIPGGTIKVLKHALLAEYGAGNRALDVCCVFGLNNLLRNRKVADIVADMKDFQNTVHRIAPPGKSNSVAIATIIIPPKLAEIEDDFEGNRFSDIVELNHQIKTLNQDQPQENFPVRYAPQFHTWGLASRKRKPKFPRNLLEGLPRHRVGQWREENMEDMLHLNDKTRLRMGKAVIAYFLALYSITETIAASKPLAIAMERKSKRAKVKKPKSMKAAKPETKFKFMSEEERAKKKLLCAQMIQFLKAHSQNQPSQAAPSQVQQ